MASGKVYWTEIHERGFNPNLMEHAKERDNHFLSNFKAWRQATSIGLKSNSGNRRPEGAGGLSPGVSTLGTDHSERRALKGRQIERTNKEEIKLNCSTSQLCALTLPQQ